MSKKEGKKVEHGITKKRFEILKAYHRVFQFGFYHWLEEDEDVKKWWKGPLNVELAYMAEGGFCVHSGLKTRKEGYHEVVMLPDKFYLHGRYNKRSEKALDIYYESMQKFIDYLFKNVPEKEQEVKTFGTILEKKYKERFGEEAVKKISRNIQNPFGDPLRMFFK